MFCTKCGAEVADDTGFCPKCGQKLGMSNSDTSPAEGGEVKGSGIEPSTAAAGAREMNYQSVGIRFAALIVDGIPLFVLFFVIGRMWAGSMGRLDSEGWKLSGGPALLFSLIMFVICALYYTLLEGSIGATLGKLVCRIRVVGEDGSQCSYGQAFNRNLLRVVDGLFGYLIGAILIWNSPKCQRLGDRVARTVVVKK